MNVYYTCSIITNSEEDKISLEKSLFQSSSEITKLNLGDGFSKISFYSLTKEKALSLKKDPRVKDIEFISSQNNNKTSHHESSIRGNYNGLYITSNILDTVDSQSTNYALVYHTSSPTFLYSGSRGTFTFNTITATYNFKNYNYTLDGTGVDLIILDDSFCHKHADFYDFNGNSRVQYIDWYQVTGKSGTMPKYHYVNESNPNDTHGTWCMSLAGGLAHGFAKGAKLYPMRVAYGNLYYGTAYDTSFNLLEALDLIKRFHTSKSIDLNTGYKRPTVVSISLKFDTNLYSSIFNIKTPRPVSTSLQIPLQDNTGVRFNVYNYDYTFISSSLYKDSSSFNINGYLDVGNVFYYSGSIQNLVNKINTTTQLGQNFFLTASANGNFLNITTSFYYGANKSYNQRRPLYIYTGSRDQLLGYSTPYGGHYLTTLFDTSSNINGQGGVTHITKIVVGGIDQGVTGNNNFVKLSQGMVHNPPYDHFGIDNGDNSVWAYFSNSPGTVNFDIYSPTIDTAMEEVAKAGVVMVQAGGNRGLHSSNTGSNNNPFFTSESYSSLLAETYIEKDVDTGTLFPANTPIYLYRSQPSNGSVIQTGVLAGTAAYQNFNYIPSSSSPPIIYTGGNTGPAIDVYALGTSCWSATITGSSFGRVNTHYLYQDINFNTQSVENYLNTYFPDAQNYVNPSYPINPKLTTIAGYESGGTSASCPIIAGLVCLFLQLNPGANIKQVREWLKSHPKLLPNYSTSIDTEFLYNKHLKFNPPGGPIGYTSSIDKSGSFQLGIEGNGNIAFFPMSSNQATFSNIQITKT